VSTSETPAAGGLKFDGEKPRMELLDRHALEQIAKVLTFGAKKYDSHNWRKGILWSRLYGAALRHLLASMDGEDTDPESGLSHLAHLGCCTLFLLWHEQHRRDLDDRYRNVAEDDRYRHSQPSENNAPTVASAVGPNAGRKSGPETDTILQVAATSSIEDGILRTIDEKYRQQGGHR
jgi:hypothetical protein